MYELKQIYGVLSFLIWKAKPTVADLSKYQQPSSEVAAGPFWPVSSFRELQEYVSFLTAMNKRLVLFYRGQGSPDSPKPMLYRPSWRCFDTNNTHTISGHRSAYWEELQGLGADVYGVCKSVGLPRPRGLRDIREVQWAVIQHYGLWPTPLIDVTSSLRMAASFAFDGEDRDRCYLFVVGMPELTGSIAFNIDQHLLLARLQSACPPVASRPHFQEGFLVGRFPTDESERCATKSDLSRRLVAKFELNRRDFWDADFPMISLAARYPPNDHLLAAFATAFGKAKGGLSDRSESIQSSGASRAGIA